jgi:ribosome maturation factor RimP
LAYSRAISEKLTPTVVGLGYELLGIEMLSSGGGTLLRCFIDKPDGITVDDCGLVSRQLSDVIEAEQLMRDAYTLEVSSPGVDRPLFTGEQIAAQVGQQIEIRLSNLVAGRRKIEGEVLSVEDEVVRISDATDEYEIPVRMIEKAKLVFRWTN